MYDRAILFYKKAISADPDYAAPYANIGLIEKIKKKYPEAIVLFGKAIDIDSTGEDAYLTYMYRGQCLLELNEYTLAIKDFTKSIDLNTENYTIYFEKGYANAMLKNYENVKQDFSIYLKHYPDEKMVHINLANVERILGNTQYSLQMHNTLIKKYPNEYLLFNNRAEVYLDLKDFSNAMKDINRALILKDRYAIGNFVKSKIYFKMNEISEACTYYNKALQYGLETNDDDDDELSEIQSQCK